MKRLSLFFILSVVSISAWSLEFDLQGILSTAYTTNTANAPSSGNEIDEFIISPGVFLGATHSSPNFELDGSYNLERRMYQEDIYSDENVIVGSAFLRWHALPDRLDLDAGNSRTETTRNSRGPSNQFNRQISSTTFLSPTLRLRLRQVDELQLQYRYSDHHTDESRIDSQEQFIAGRYIFTLSPNRSLTLEHNQRQIDYEGGFIPKIDGKQTFLAFDQIGNNWDIRLRGGHTELKREGSKAAKGAFGELDTTWRLSAATSLNARAAHDITDRSANLYGGENAFGQIIFEDTNTADIFTSNNALVGIRHTFPVAEVGITATYEKNDYEETPNDRRRRRVELDALRKLSPRTSLAAYLHFGRDQYLNDNAEIKTQDAGIELTWDRSRTLGLQFSIEYIDADGENALTRSYQEWRGVITLKYSPLAR